MLDQSLLAEPLTYFSFQPMLHSWCSDRPLTNNPPAPLPAGLGAAVELPGLVPPSLNRPWLLPPPRLLPPVSINECDIKSNTKHGQLLQCHQHRPRGVWGEEGEEGGGGEKHVALH